MKNDEKLFDLVHDLTNKMVMIDMRIKKIDRLQEMDEIKEVNLGLKDLSDYSIKILKEMKDVLREEL
jgi:hypothetical protein